jgi:coenzyme PQQ precursor peptide PqqA
MGFFGPLLRFPMAPIDSRAVPHWRLSRCGHHGRDNKRGYTMSWKTPKITEISVGMEINMYACAMICRPAGQIFLRRAHGAPTLRVGLIE